MSKSEKKNNDFSPSRKTWSIYHMAEKGKLQSSTLFKQIGVDVDFVAQNANESNNRLNDLYWNKTSGQRHGTGGQIENVKLPKNLSMIRNYDVDVNHGAVRSMAGGDASYAAAPEYRQSHQPSVQQHTAPQHTLQLDATVAAPGAPAQVAFDHAMITQLKAEIMSEMANQIAGLASKMQQFADQTDRAISELQRSAQAAHVNQRPAQAAPAASKPDVSNNPAAAKLAEQNSIDPASVSVSKMFNFSHSGGSGKRV